jgi:hypothetical protein
MSYLVSALPHCAVRVELRTSFAPSLSPSVLNTTLAAGIGAVTQYMEHGTPLEDDVVFKRPENLG